MRYELELLGSADPAVTKPSVLVEPSLTDGQHSFPRTVCVRIGERSFDAVILDPGPPCLLSVDGKIFEVRLANAERRPDAGVLSASSGLNAHVRSEQQLALHTASASTVSGEHSVKSPMPGRVLRLLVAEGEAVTQGQPLMVIEAMKMENELFSPANGTLSKLNVSAGDTVEASALLLTIQA